MIFLDFEVFRYNWLVVLIDTNKRTVIKINDDVKLLSDYYNEHKTELFIGYNIKGYDQYIFKGILAGFNPFDISDWIINRKLPGFQFSKLLRNYPLIIYDVYVEGKGGLKKLEAFQGHNIHETGVDFKIDRPLTKAEINTEFEYCTNDVIETMNVFKTKFGQDEFNAKMSFLSEFKDKLNVMDLSKTKVQLATKVLGARKPDKPRDDEWDYEVRTDKLRIKKYKHIVDWFIKQKSIKNNKAFLITEVGGIPHKFGWGGGHGAPGVVNKKGDDIDGTPTHRKGLLIHVDVKSYYPSLMIIYGWLSRNVPNPKLFKDIYDKRLYYKAHKDPRQAPFKIIINGTYGASNDKKNLAMYDPRQAKCICVNGQLFLVDLIEHLEAVPGIEFINSNTDGLIINIPNTDEAFQMVDDICYEWESRIGIGLGFDQWDEIYQKDVNNYVIIDNSKIEEQKGLFVKEQDELDNDLPILNKALLDRILHGVPVEKTILDCNDLMMFQKVVSVSDKFEHAVYGATFRIEYTPGISPKTGKPTKGTPKRIYNKDGKVMTEKYFRVFASTLNCGGLYKYRDGENPKKFELTSLNSFIDNGHVKDKQVPPYLDRKYYIELAQQRATAFGLN